MNTPVNRKNNLDELRFFGAFLVFFHHTFYMWDDPRPQLFIYNMIGTLGVHLSFLISGYIFTKVYSNYHWDIKNTIKFYLTRLARLLPLMLVILTIASLLYPSRYNFWDNLDWIFLGGPTKNQYGVFWTLIIEFKFYLIFPIMLLIFKQIIQRFRLNWIVLFSLLIFFIFYNGKLIFNSTNLKNSNILFLFFAFGILLSEIKPIEVKNKIPLLILFFSIPIILFFWQELSNSRIFVKSFPIILFIFFLRYLSKGSYPLPKLGWMSYSVYCIHSLLIQLFRTFFRKIEFYDYVWYFTPLIFLIVLGLSYLISKYFEYPTYLYLKDKIKKL